MFYSAHKSGNEINTLQITIYMQKETAQAGIF